MEVTDLRLTAPISRPSKRSSRSCRSRTRRAWSTRSTCSSRSTSATSSRRCSSITNPRTVRQQRAARDRRGAQRHRGELAAAGPAHAGRRRLRRSRRRDRRDRRHQQRGRDDAVTAAACRSGSAHSRHRGGRAGQQRQRPRTWTPRRRRSSISQPIRASSSRDVRRDVAAAIRHIDNPRFRRLLIPLLYDDSARGRRRGDGKRAGRGLVGLRLRPDAGRAAAQPPARRRAPAQVLVSYGDPVVDVLAHFMRDADEDIWVRRHIPTDARADPLAEVGRRADRGARRT